jgi:hypothetical protein
VDLIMIRTDSSERGHRLASCLRTLFPLCEIVVQLENLEAFESVSKVPSRPTYDIRSDRSKGFSVSTRK